MKKKTIPVPILIELIVLAVIIALLIGVTIRNSKNKQTNVAETQSEVTVGTEADADVTAEPAAASATTTAEPTATPVTGTVEVWGGNYSYTPVQNSSDISAPAVISFPYQDTSSGIVIGNVSSYDGIYLEDSSDEEVSGVAVLMLQNLSGYDFELVQITLTQGDTEYHFEVSAVPQGAVVAVQEKDRKACPDGSFNSCSVATTEATFLDMSTDLVTVTEMEDGSLQVTNISGFTIPCVRIFYKYYSEEDAAYVGGITYTAKLTDLESDQTVTVNPSHYVAGYSKVVMVKTYDSADN